MTRPLQIAACRSICGWRDTGHDLDGEPLFACSGCGSEWVPSQAWTPVDYTGEVPVLVAEVRAAEEAARGVRGRG